MDIDDVDYKYTGILFSHKEEYYVVCKKMDGTGDDQVKKNKSD
jgi:hypothetical protein